MVDGIRPKIQLPYRTHSYIKLLKLGKKQNKKFINFFMTSPVSIKQSNKCGNDINKSRVKLIFHSFTIENVSFILYNIKNYT